ncbi:MAG: EamA family transporter [Patescibacteria group bacterium]|nr:EamA family transporter [Patescibacteria group bacterium]MDE2588842.1 EamA family transporter [Patescibacteria group bacterium]
MLWFWLAFLAGICSNVFNFFSRFVLKDKDDPTAYAWYFELIRFVSFTVVAFVDWRLIITLQSIALFILLAITEVLASYWLMKMHQYNHLSISTILSRTRLLWVPILGFFIMRESLRPLEYAGIAVLFLGVSITAAPSKILFDKGVRYANLDSFVIALNIIFTKMALPFASNSVLNDIMVAPSVVLFPFLMKNAKKRIQMLFKKKIFLKSFAILINVASVYLFTQALRVGDASKVTAIYQGMMILSVLAGIVVLKEKQDIKRKLIGAVITLIGVYLLEVL